MAGERVIALTCWERGFAALERLSPAPDVMTTEERMDCAEVYFCLIRGQDLEQREQARSAEGRAA